MASAPETDFTTLLSYRQRRRDMLAAAAPEPRAAVAQSHAHVDPGILRDILQAQAPPLAPLPSHPLPAWTPGMPGVQPLWQGAALRPREVVAVALATPTGMLLRFAVRLPGFRGAKRGDAVCSSEVVVAVSNSDEDGVGATPERSESQGAVFGARLLVRHVDPQHPGSSSACLQVRAASGAGLAVGTCSGLAVGVASVDAVRSRGRLYDTLTAFGNTLSSDDCHMVEFEDGDLDAAITGQHVWCTPLSQGDAELQYVHTDGSVVYVVQMQVAPL